MTVNSKRDRNIKTLLSTVLLFLEAAGSLAGAEEGAKQVLLWIRAGTLSAGEAEGDPEETPRLRELVLEGVTAAEIILPDPLPFDPKAIAALLFDEPSRQLIRESRGAPVAEIGPQKDDQSRDAPGAYWNHPVVALLEKRFGRPPPPSEDEEASVQRIRVALGMGAAAAESTGQSAEAAAPRPAPPATDKGEDLKPEAEALDIAKRAIASLEDGAPLVIALEPVRDPARSKARDAALGALAASLRGRDVFLIVLSARGEGPGPRKGEGPATRIAFTVAGPGVRSGVLIGERRPLAAATATTFRLLGIRPPAGDGSEAINVLKR